MCKYEMDPVNIVQDTERTGFCPQKDRRTESKEKDSNRKEYKESDLEEQNFEEQV